jgi:hypothetical protein
MSVTSNLSVLINFSGGVISNTEFRAVENTESPGSVTLHSLSSGNNTITVPSSSGVTVKGATIVPPSDNTQTLTLKGIAGDTGIALSKVNPTAISFDTAPANFVLNAGGTISGLRIIWT